MLTLRSSSFPLPIHILSKIMSSCIITLLPQISPPPTGQSLSSNPIFTFQNHIFFHPSTSLPNLKFSTLLWSQPSLACFCSIVIGCLLLLRIYPNISLPKAALSFIIASNRLAIAGGTSSLYIPHCYHFHLKLHSILTVNEVKAIFPH